MRLGAVHFGAVLLAVALLGVAGCGRPATEAECEQILERTARLELRERMGEADAKLLDAEVNATKVVAKDGPLSLDLILDFDANGDDRIDLRGIDANEGVAGAQAFSFVGKAAGKDAGELSWKSFGRAVTGRS